MRDDEQGYSQRRQSQYRLHCGVGENAGAGQVAGLYMSPPDILSGQGA
jgi:hypothetical protein